MRHFVEDRLWCVGCVASVHETALTKVFFCPVIAAVTTFKLCGACVFCLTVALGYISREELLQDWNYRLRKPCGYNPEAAKREEKACSKRLRIESFIGSAFYVNSSWCQSFFARDHTNVWLVSGIIDALFV